MQSSSSRLTAARSGLIIIRSNSAPWGGLGNVTTFGRTANRRGGSRGLIALIVLALSHAPLPVADFHTIAHHDAPGEVCELHDHLLRWHPDAGNSESVAVLHWHWLSPLDFPWQTAASDRFPAIHAHAGEAAIANWNADLSIVPEPSEAARIDLSIRHQLVFVISACDLIGAGEEPRAGPPAAPQAYSATFGESGRLIKLLHHFTC